MFSSLCSYLMIYLFSYSKIKIKITSYLGITINIYKSHFYHLFFLLNIYIYIYIYSFSLPNTCDKNLKPFLSFFTYFITSLIPSFLCFVKVAKWALFMLGKVVLPLTMRAWRFFMGLLIWALRWSSYMVYPAYMPGTRYNFRSRWGV